jgi:chaperonin cofactor prefoldin
MVQEQQKDALLQDFYNMLHAMEALSSNDKAINIYKKQGVIFLEKKKRTKMI